METLQSYKKLIDHANTSGSPLALWAVPSDESLHPCATDLAAVFIRDCVSHATICVPFNHPDIAPFIDINQFVSDVNSLKVAKWALDKKSFIQLCPLNGIYDLNLYKHLKEGETLDLHSFDTNAHRFIYRHKKGCGDLNRAVPIFKHKEMFDNMCKRFPFEGEMSFCYGGFKKENDNILGTLAQLEMNGIHVEPNCFSQHFNAPIQPNGLVYSQYNIYTSTGRPSNHFNNVNYAALNKENGVRKCFVSRYGKDGSMALIDYSAFHPRIISHLIEFEFVRQDVDIYKYLGELYFGRSITEYDMPEIKRITMRQLYGGVEEKYEHIKYLAQLKEYIASKWSYFKKQNYVETPIFKRRITNKHIADPNPNKLFNYILQATETEIAIPTVNIVNQYLANKRTKAVLYTYDSVLFDFHKEEMNELAEIIGIMMMDDRFPVKVYVGESYESVKQIYP